MNKLSRVANVVDDFIYGRIPVAQARSAYDKIIEPAYKQLTYRDGGQYNFYNGERLRGYVDPNGDVGFIRKYPELNRFDLAESYSSPEEIINRNKFHQLGLDEKQIQILQNYPQPTRELIKLGTAFKDYSNSPEGARLYHNMPISDHREKAYKKWGFESTYDYEMGRPIQYLDKRPYADNELINKVYLIGDTYSGGTGRAELTLNQRVNNNKLQGSRVADLSKTLVDVEDYIQNMPSRSYSQEYSNPYLPQELSPQQQRDSNRFAQMRSNSRQQAQINPDQQAIIQRYIHPDYTGNVEIYSMGDNAYDLMYGDVYREINQEQFNQLHNALQNQNRYPYAFNPF